MCSVTTTAMCLSRLAAVAVQAQTSQAQTSTTAFVNVSVVPMDRERILTEQTVVVQGGRIAALGPVAQIHVPTDAVQIDGRGKFLLPGLADMHAHLPSPDYMMADRLLLYLANGVTTIREMMSEPAHVELERQIANGALLGPRMYTAGLINANRPVADIADAIGAYQAHGYDFLKFYGSAKDLSTFDSVMAMARRAHMRVVGHVYEMPGVQRALQAHIASIEHLWGYPECIGFLPPAQWLPQCENAKSEHGTVPTLPPDYELDTIRLRHLAAETQRAGVWNTPTLVVVKWLATHSKWPPAESHQRLKWHQQIVKALADAGAGLLLGTDLPNAMSSPMLAGFAIHQELDLLVEAGLSPYQALEAGTKNPARFFGTLDSTGTIAVGKRADLILLDGNPLRDVRYLRRPAGTMVGGRWLSRVAIEDRLHAMLRDGGSRETPAADRGMQPGRKKELSRETWARSLEEMMAEVRRLPAP